MRPLDASAGDEELRQWLVESAKNEMLVQELDLGYTQVSDVGAETLAASSSLAKLHNLDLRGTQISNAGVQALARSPYLTQLHSLDLTKTRVGDSGLQALAASTSLTQLHSLFLDETRVSDAGVVTLAASTSLTYLHRLHLANTGVSDEGLQALAASTSLTQLHSLHLNETQVGDAGVQALAASTSFTQLHSLHLSRTRVGDAGIQALAASTSLTQLHRLHLTRTRVGDAGVLALASSTTLTQLHCLDLGWWEVGDAGVLALAASPSMTQLQSLNLSLTKVTDTGIQALAASASLTQLHSLNLSLTHVTDVGVQALAASTSLTQLRSLHLDETKMSDAGLQALAASTSLPHLHSLHLSRTGVGDAGLQALAASNSLPQLHFIDLTGTRVSSAQIKRCTDAQIILHFFREAKGGEPLLEVKVPILGMGGNGKSLLRRRLAPRNAKEPVDEKNNPPTHAFVKNPVLFKVGRAGSTYDCTLQLFDFGGQPEMHGAHRFFLADQRNVYIVLVNSRLDLRQNRLNHWLRMVKHHGAGAPTIVVVSHCDEYPGADDPTRSSSSRVPILEPLDAAQLTKEHGINVQVVDDYSNIDGKNLEKVKEALNRAVSELTSVFEARFPPGFFQVMKWLNGEPPSAFADHVSFESVLRVDHHFRKACETVGQADAGQQNLWLILLRDLGYLHYVGDRPEVKRNAEHGLAEVIFHPEWVKLPVYDIVRDAEARINQGITLRSRLENILEQRGVSSVNERRWILALMCACELIFKVSGGAPNNERYFVPDQLGLRPKNATIEWVQTPKKKLLWVFPFLPDHLLLQLFGRWFDRHPEDHAYYRDEVILRSDDSSCRVRLSANFNEDTIYLEFDAKRDLDWHRFHAKLESAMESILDPEKLLRRDRQNLWCEEDLDRKSKIKVNEKELFAVASAFFELRGWPKNVDEIQVWINATRLRDIYFQTEALEGSSQRVAYRTCYLHALSKLTKTDREAPDFPLEPTKSLMAEVLNWLHDAPQLKKLLLVQADAKTLDNPGNLSTNYRNALHSLGHELKARRPVVPKTPDRRQGRKGRPIQGSSGDDDRK